MRRHSPSEEQYQWIAYTLLWKLMGNNSSNVDCNTHRNIQTQLDYIQVKNALDLCGNVPDYLYKVFSQICSYNLHVLFGEIKIKG